MDKLDYIVEVFDVVLPILFWATLISADYVLYDLSSTFFEYLFIKQAVNLKGLDYISIALDKNRR